MVVESVPESFPPCLIFPEGKHTEDEQGFTHLLAGQQGGGEGRRDPSAAQKELCIVQQAFGVV
jgi:hypothetical protein